MAGSVGLIQKTQDREPAWEPMPKDLAALGIDPTDANRCRQLMLLMKSAYLAGRIDAYSEQAARWAEQAARWDDLKVAMGGGPRQSRA